ncbi:MAG: hypothetical protein AAB527_03735 [Patescibacteria group bacterium]
MRFESTMPAREGRINEIFLVGRPKFKFVEMAQSGSEKQKQKTA